MDKKLVKLESTYWRIAKIVGIIFTLINYQMWTSTGNVETTIKGMLLIGGVAVGVFLAINLLDVVVGMIRGIFKYIQRNIKDRRLLKGFYAKEIYEEESI